LILRKLSFPFPASGLSWCLSRLEA
jgi:hypothetical protein